MTYEVELPDESIDGLYRGRVYAVEGTKRTLLGSFVAPTWRHVREEAKAIRASHATARTYVFNDDDELVAR
jgi:hypothetical protein